jgi:hypothetical protein
MTLPDFRKLMTTIGATAIAAASAPASATVIDFTGGTVTFFDGTTAVTDGSASYQAVDYYEEDGFRFDFIGPHVEPFEGIAGNYYGLGNDVVHGHWATGDYGGLTEIRVSRTDGASFDLNYFVLTSNTDTGGSTASGNERAFVHASLDGSTISSSLLLPPDDWGFAGPNAQIFLDDGFDDILYFSFTVENAVDCFGMDRFFIDEPPPVSAPEPGSLALLGFGLLGLFAVRRRRS